jgi:hypothetical protein
MNKETAEIVNDYYLTVVEWWNRSMEPAPITDPMLKSTTVWTQFKRDMGDKLGNIDATVFKDVLCGFLGEDKVVKPKTKAGALEIRGCRLRHV